MSGTHPRLVSHPVPATTLVPYTKPEDLTRAVRAVASLARGVADLELLLDMLGLDPRAGVIVVEGDEQG